MQRIIVASAFIAVLSGCSLATTDVLNNDFSSIQQASAPPSIVGTWTGSSGPYLMTIVINENGGGLSCYAWNTNKTVGRVKYDGGQLVLQDGSKMRVTASGDVLTGRASYTGAKDISFRRDTNLENADPYCVKNL